MQERKDTQRARPRSFTRSVIVLGALAFLVAPQPSVASRGYLSSTNVRFDAPVPCGSLCPYVRDGHVELLEGTVHPRPVQDPAVEACKPEPLAPPLSWDDIAVEVPDQVAGRAPTHLALEIYPQIDHDAFLCSVTHRGTPQEQWEPVRGQCYLCGLVWPECHVGGTHTGLGCAESLIVQVTPGMTIILRVFNQADTASCFGRYRFYG